MAYRQQSSVPFYGLDGTYFVENEGSHIHGQGMEAKEYARAIARQQQCVIAEDLSQATCEEYQEDILDHMEHMESQTRPDVSSIDIQTEIQWYMRPYLLDFLVEAHAAFQLLPETLYLTVNLLDRYCSKRVVYKHHYQLVGCAALLIASKYGDRKDRVPTVKELRSMCCAMYEEEMFTQMEWHVLVTLNWLIGHPTVDSFLQVALSDSSPDPEAKHMAWYISELAMYHRDFVSTLPSVMARSALALALCILGRPLSKHPSWSEEYDSATAWRLTQKIALPSRVLAKKYASPQLSAVSGTVERFLRHQAMTRQMAPLTPPNDFGFEQQKLAPDGYTMPQTPQKPSCPMSMPHGYATPPITPDGQLGAADALTKSQEMLNQGRPSTPTPPSSAASLPAHQYMYTYPAMQSVEHQVLVQ